MNKIILNKTLKEYEKRYKNRGFRLLKFTKKEVAEFDKLNPTVYKNFLLRNRSWWLIADTYYEVPNPPRYTWFRNLNAGVQIATSIFLGGAIVSSAVIPSILLNRGYTLKLDGDSKNEATITTNKLDEQGNRIIVIEAKQSGNEVDVLEVKKGNDKLEENKDYTFDDESQTVKIFKSALEAHQGDVTIKVKVDVIAERFTITFESNGGTSVSSMKVKKGKKASKPVNPSKEHYLFSSWCIDDDLKKTFDFSTPITSNITLYARWTDKKHVVTFVTNGGMEIIDPVEVVDGATVSKPEVTPTNDLRTFVGWYVDEQCTIEFDFSKEITSPTNIYAKWDDKDVYVKGTHNVDINDTSTQKVSLLTKDGIEVSATRWMSSDTSVVSSISSDGTMALTPHSKYYTFYPGGLTTITGYYNDPTTNEEKSTTFDVSVATFSGLKLQDDNKSVFSKRNSYACSIPYYWYKEENGQVKKYLISEIAERAFEEDRVTQYCFMHDNITKINKYAFYGATMDYAQLPSKLEYLGHKAFYQCGLEQHGDSESGLETIVIPKTIKVIEGSPFMNVSHEQRGIPVKLDELDDSSFLIELGSFNSLTEEIKYDAITDSHCVYSELPPKKKTKFLTDYISPKDNGNGKFYTLKKQNITSEDQLDFTYYGDGTTENPYICSVKALPGCSGDIIVPSTVTKNNHEYTVSKLDDYAFMDSDVELVVLPESIKEISKGCFKNCKKLIGIDTDYIETIGEEACYGCSLLKNITIGKRGTSKVSKICKHAFLNSGLENATIPLNADEMEKEMEKSKWQINDEVIEINPTISIKDELISTYVDYDWSRVDPE